MSNEKLGMSNVRFRQSVNDYPVIVSLGEKIPAWRLSRFCGDCDLRFIPPDDEGFSLRGDSRQLVYKGRKKSHRFTILSDGAFEYDCILLREPESNIISLRMEGAEQFDFLRQPDFVSDPFLKGSYAVYKKETFIGEGTGKLCHIHRPKIIEACGSWCWGELAVVGNELLIIVPESFLSNAKYPVVVDPIVGTTTVGSQTTWYDSENEDYYPLYIEASLAVNRFLLPESLSNTATAYVYAYESDYDGRCKPVLYSDNNNVPLSRRSMSEGSFDIAVGSGKPAGWRSTTFKPNTSIASGSYVWFGLFCDWFYPRFDFGAKCYREFFDDDIPDIYPVYNKNYFYDFKLSMYFTYTSAQNYVRTLTQGVRLTDTRKRTSSFKRGIKQNVNVNSGINRFETFIRKCVMTARASMNMNRFSAFFREATERVKISSIDSVMRSLLRKCSEMITVQFSMKRIQGFIRSIFEHIQNDDSIFFPVLLVCSMNDKTVLYESTKQTAEYIRTLEVKSKAHEAISHIADYYRFQKDNVQAEGNVFRSLLLFVMIKTKLFVRDYIIHRFLKAREELKLKSCISRKIILMSRII